MENNRTIKRADFNNAYREAIEEISTRTGSTNFLIGDPPYCSFGSFNDEDMQRYSLRFSGEDYGRNNGILVQDLESKEEPYVIRPAKISDLERAKEMLIEAHIYPDKIDEIVQRYNEEVNHKEPFKSIKKSSPSNKTFKKYSKEEIAAAEKVDIVEYCKKNGIALENTNTRYPNLKMHDSLKIDRQTNTWKRWSTGEKGNAINFVRLVSQCSFPEAVKGLLSEDNQMITIPEDMKVGHYEIQPFVYSFKESSEFDQARQYLINQRKIDPDMVDWLHKEGLLMQEDSPHKNLITKWKDWKTGELEGAALQGTGNKKANERSFKHIHANNTPATSFNIKIGQPKEIKFGESVIDLLSYATMRKKQGYNTRDTWLVSMEGLKDSVVSRYTKLASEELGYTPNVAFVVDNDKAGVNFYEKQLLGFEELNGIEPPDFISPEFPPEEKDWNDYLKKTISEESLGIKRINGWDQRDNVIFIKEHFDDSIATEVELETDLEDPSFWKEKNLDLQI